MKKSLLSIAAMSVLTTGLSAEVTHLTTAGLGASNYEYEGMDSFTYTVLDLGYNAGWDDFYLSVNAMLPLSDGETNLEYDTQSSLDVTFKRYQYSLNVGYRLEMGVSVFAGINYANNELDFSDPTTSQITEITETGAHIGIAGTLYSFEGIGAVTAKGAISISQMEYNDFSQNGTGLLYGLGWFGLVSEDLNYYINLDGYSYYYDEGDTASLTFKAGLGYAF